MHCEIVVPGLLSQRDAPRLPALELLLARGRETVGDARALETWLLEAFEIEAKALPAGALTLLAHGIPQKDGLWARADPVHLRVMRDHILVVPGAGLQLARAEADALCAALNGHFGARLELHAVEALRWCARLEAPLELSALPALELAGRGPAAGARADALLNEVQMLLHEHPVNEAREARGEPAINSLWLWGAGPAAQAVAGHWQSVSADDPVALGLARAANARARPLSASGADWLERSPEDGRHLIVLDALRAPLAAGDAAAWASRAAALEQGWFAPLLAGLRAGRVGMLTIHVPDAASGVSFETIRGDLRRFWRRPRPLTGRQRKN
jgi:hypothetical protein